MIKPLRGPAVSEAIRTYIKDYILTNGLKPGDLLPPESQMMEDLGVGRSSVREAVKALQSLGIVEIRRGDGLYVREANFDSFLESLSYNMRFDHTMFGEVFQMRVWLETAVIGDAIAQIGEQEIAKLKELLADWHNYVAKGENPASLDAEFHYILYRQLNNQTLLKLLEVFWLAFEQVNSEVVRISDPEHAIAQHEALLESIISRDAALTRQRLIEHFGPVQQRIEKAVKHG